MTAKWNMSIGILMVAQWVQAAFVTIGDPGNNADTSGYGAVPYTFQIATTEVTVYEFMQSGAGDGDEGYWNDAGRGGGPAAPAANVSWYEAAKYCNWLTTGNTNNGAYQFDGSGILTNVLSRTEILASDSVFYVLPTEDEWHKAAYYTGSASNYWSVYADGADTIPPTGTNGWNYNYVYSRTPWPVGTGAKEQNGTFDLMGNVWEWTESPSDGTLNNLAESRAARGGSYVNVVNHLSSGGRDNNNALTLENPGIGFRVVALPASDIPWPATEITRAIPSAGGLALEWDDAEIGYVYQIDWTTNLTSGFMPLSSQVEFPQHSYTSAVDQAQAFFRVEIRQK